MLDGKVLTAVLGTLAVVAAAINSGGISAETLKANPMSAPGKASFNSLVPESLSSLGDFLRNPKPETQIDAEFRLEDLSGEDFRVKNSRLKVGELHTLNIDGGRVSSKGIIEIYGFTGTVDPGQPSRIKGKARGLVSRGVNFSGGFRIDREIDTSLIRVVGTERSGIRFGAVSGTVTSSDSSTDIISPTKLEINSFSGDIQVTPANRTVRLEGKVDRLEAGSFGLG